MDGLLVEGSSSGMLYALDPASGATDWSGNVGTGINGPDEQNVSSPLTGLGAGENTIIVPAGSRLNAYAGANVGTGTPSDTVAPTISGQPVAGRSVGADVGVWTALPTSYTYAWYLCDFSGDDCSAIAGATGEAYAPPAVDGGDTLKVAVTAIDASGTSSAVTSAASAPIVVPPLPTCTVSAVRRPGPYGFDQEQVTVQSQAGLNSITGVNIDNGTVEIPSFNPGTTAPVVITATKANQRIMTHWSFDATDSLGRRTACA